MIKDVSISVEEWNEISSQLEIHHALFYQLWQMGRPVFDTNIKTAAVRFNEQGQYVVFVFNPEFWSELTSYERRFIICHESLHVIFNHGIRMLNTKQPDICNIAMDIVVNHSLIEKFGFHREQLSMDKELCWIDTVFKDPVVAKKVEFNKTFEYYFSKIKKEVPNLSMGSVDDHNGLPQMGSKEWDEVIKRLDESLSDEEKAGIKDLVEKHTQRPPKGQSKGRGTQGLGAWHFVTKQPVKKKRKWETVIRKWAKKYMKRDIETVEQWVRPARRMALLPKDLLLPSEVDHDSWSQDRIQVWFFQDCSGSCIGLKDRFFKAAKSLPKERFDVKMHTFDTRVFEVDINQGRVRGGGGTSFSCMENYIQQYMKKHKVPYPKAVFVITDGMGNMVRPQHPDNWFWFLSYNYRYCIPKESHVFMLNDFE